MPLVRADKKALVFKVREAAKKKGLLPRAKLLDENHIAAPHTIETLRAADSIGLSVAKCEPIRYYYEWPPLEGVKPPMPHQIDTAAFGNFHDRGYVLNQMRTGKTAACLWGDDYQKYGSTLIITTASCVNTVWAQQIQDIWPFRKTVSLTGASDRRQRLLRQPSPYYIINHDGIKIGAGRDSKGKRVLTGFAAELEYAVRSGRIGRVIVDEGSEFKNYSSDRAKVLALILKSARSVWWLTGTPVPNSPEDAYAQVRICTPHMLNGMSESAWKAHTMDKDPYQAYKWTPKPDWLQRVSAVMQPAICFQKKDLFTLPPLTVQDLEVGLDDAHAKQYKRLKANMVLEVEGQVIEAVHAGALRQKLLMVSAGVANDVDGKKVTFNVKKRLNEVKRIVEQSRSKVIVFAAYRCVCDLLETELAEIWPNGVKLYGGINGAKRDDIIRKFQTDPDCRWFVAHPKTTGHGLELAVADTIVWYSPAPSADLYTQASERIQSNKQQNAMAIYHLVATELEKQVYKDHRAKISDQREFLLHYIRQTETL
jgi:SNF2-related domain